MRFRLLALAALLAAVPASASMNGAVSAVQGNGNEQVLTGGDGLSAQIVASVGRVRTFVRLGDGQAMELHGPAAAPAPLRVAPELAPRRAAPRRARPSPRARQQLEHAARQRLPVQ